MAEAKQFVFDFKELAELLVRRQAINEGHWGIFVRFGIQGANVSRGESDLVPAAIVPILEIGIQKFDEPNPLTVDATKIGSEEKKRKRRSQSKP